MNASILAASTPLTLRLADLAIGQQAVVAGYERHPARYLNRLLAMGLTRGSVIRVVRKAPLGDPIDISLRGYNLTLRRDEASVLHLSPVEANISPFGESAHEG